MIKRKKILSISSLGLVTVFIASCGKDANLSFSHTISKFNAVYSADINHDGIIDPDTETKLTWSQSYDVLMRQSNSLVELNKAADAFNIDSNEPKRTSLARYEILHQAEELLMSTGAVYPIYSYGSAFLLKPNLTGMYTSSLGYKYLDRISYKDNPNVAVEQITATVGTRAETFDPAANSDASTAIILQHILTGAMRYAKSEELDKENDPDIYKAEVEDGLCQVTKKIVTQNSTKAQSNPDDYVDIQDCADLQAAINAGVATPDEYESTARYTLKIDPTAKWNDGSSIETEDFLYSWNRTSSAIYNGQPFGVWGNLYDSIRGYETWANIGQQTSANPNEWDENAQAFYNSLDTEEQNKCKFEYKQVFDKYQCAGGMAGITDDSANKTITIQLINDCDYFKELLAACNFAPVDKSSIIKIPAGKSDKEVICDEDPSWWMKAETFHTSGQYQLAEDIKNYEGGKIVLKKNENCASKLIDDKTVKNITFKFVDSDVTAYEEYKKNGGLNYTAYIPSSMLDYEKKNPDFHSVTALGSFYHTINVNDNTFDIENEKDPISGERKREQLRKIFLLLVNRHDITKNIVKSGARPLSGCVSYGITETCYPVHSDSSNASSSYVAAVDGDGEYLSTDWHNRNLDTYDNLINPTVGDEYKNHIMSNRNDNKREDGTSGFFPLTEECNVDKEIEIDNMTASSEIALQLAKEAGLDYNEKTGKFTNFPRVTIITNSGSGLEDIIERTQAYYKLWGIDVTIKTEEWQTFTATRRRGDFAVARQGWIADFNDPRTYLDLYCSNDGNNDSQLGRDTWHISR